MYGRGCIEAPAVGMHGILLLLNQGVGQVYDCFKKLTYSNFKFQLE